MLEMRRLNGETVWINPDQIKMIFASPDTTLIFTDGSSLTVKDSIETLEKSWLRFRQSIALGPTSSDEQHEGTKT